MKLYLCISSDDALYLYQVSRKYLKGFQSHQENAVCILKGFQSYQEGAVCILKFSKGHNSVNSQGGVINQVLSKYLKGFQIYGLEQ